MPQYADRPRVLAVWLIIAGVIGWIAAFALTMDKFLILENPEATLGCNFSVLVQCGANLESWQGSVFGFPNPLLGLTGWMAPIVVGVAVLSGARFPKWFWFLFALGMTFAFGLVCWLISQSIFVLGTLCPWCMVTWSVTIPSFFAVWLHLMRNGTLPVGARGAEIADRVSSWVPVITLGCFALIAVMAQLRLDLVSYLL